MLLDGKKLLVTGVLERRSIAFSVAAGGSARRSRDRADELRPRDEHHEDDGQAATVPPDVLELDATKPEDAQAVCEELRRRWRRLDGWMHSIAYAPEDALGGRSSARRGSARDATALTVRS